MSHGDTKTGVREKGGATAARKSSREKRSGGRAKRGKTLEPRQERSRESEKRLMRAAAEVLGRHGVDGTTIPRIAAHAGLTPGAVYRRFSDKDSLLEAVVLRIMEQQDEQMRTGPLAETAAQIPLPVLAEQVVHSLLLTYRGNAALIRAVRKFTQESRNEAFQKKVQRLEAKTFERLVETVMASAGEIRHANPRMVVSVGLLMVISTLYELILLPWDMRAWKGLLPEDDVALRRELTRAFLAYLGL